MPELNSDHLPLYYKRLFPYDQFYEWLSYRNANGQPWYFERREVSFTLADDIYIRFKSFNNQAEFESEIKKMCPHKIDIGAVYSSRPKDQRFNTVFQPVEKELLFDIDMTDYDEVRTCCSAAEICQKCWKFMAAAIKVLDTALREDFGFTNLLWVFSGRRGVHCWVCDSSARKLSTEARAAVAEYLSIVKGGDDKAKKVSLGQKLHPHIQRSVSILEEYIEPVLLEEQAVMDTPERVAKILELIEDESDRTALKARILSKKSSKDRWALLEGFCKGQEDSKTRFGSHLREEIVLQYLYPRLDIAVSKGLNHLLKAPFCLHPKTGKVCIPIDPTKADDFNPDTVPTIEQLLSEIDIYGAQHDTDEDKAKKLKDYQKTSLYPSVKLLEKFLSNLTKTSKGQKILLSDEAMEF